MPKICCNQNTKALRTFNNLSLCNKFLKTREQKEIKFKLKLSHCRNCGLLQLEKAVQANKIAQQHAWMRYFEPEEHLDDLTQQIKKICKFSNKKTIAGITYKDDTLLKRFRKKLNSKSWRIKPKIDLKIKYDSAASETVLPKINSTNVKKLIRKYGQADLLVGRHILEHAPNTFMFLNQLKKLTKPNGYILFEVPDCTKQIQNNDYTMLWEEHNLYFTPETLENYFASNFPNFELVKLFKYKYPIENALLVLLKRKKVKNIKKNKYKPSRNLKMTDNYIKNFNFVRDSIIKKLIYLKDKYGKIAIFGAGHISIMFINLLNLKKYIDFVVDDNTNKQKHLMPGSKLEIKNSSYLVSNKVKICLMSLNPFIERKVVNKNKVFLKNGGKFISIFPYKKNQSIFGNIKL